MPHQSLMTSHDLRSWPLFSRTSSSILQSSQTAIDDLRKLRVKELKDQLQAVGLPTNDVFEKEDLVRRLFHHMEQNPANYKSSAQTQNSPGDKSNSASSNVKQSKSTSTRSAFSNRVPLHYFSLDEQPVYANNRNDVSFRPTAGKFPAIRVTIPTSSKAPNTPLTLLVDTACSGIVLRPSKVEEYGLQVSTMGGVSMTAAGGTAKGTGLSRIESLCLEDGSQHGNFPVAVQDIGALPKDLDGIIGLSFLNQFQCVEFDFRNDELVLTKNRPQEIDLELEIMSEADMKLCRLGVWTLDVTLDGRGPVKMLLDTGASSTFLNWPGVTNLNMNWNHPLISQNPNTMGAMGADNNAMALTHRFVAKRWFQVCAENGSTLGMFSTGLDLQEVGPVDIDIGDLPVLEQLKSENVNGILGSDILMRCDVLRLTFLGSSTTITLLKERKE